MTQPNPSPNSFMQQSGRKTSRTQSPRLPVLSNLAGPIQHFKYAILNAWRDKVAADFCAREGCRGGPLLDIAGTLQLLRSSNVRERDEALLRSVLVGGGLEWFQPIVRRECGQHMFWKRLRYVRKLCSQPHLVHYTLTVGSGHQRELFWKAGARWARRTWQSMALRRTGSTELVSIGLKFSGPSWS